VRVLLGELRQADVPAEIATDRRERIRKAMEPPRFASAESGRKSYAGGVFHDDRAKLPGLAALLVSQKFLSALHQDPAPSIRRGICKNTKGVLVDGVLPSLVQSQIRVQHIGKPAGGQPGFVILKSIMLTAPAPVHIELTQFDRGFSAPVFIYINRF
jgi:hypothetical protein